MTVQQAPEAEASAKVAQYLAVAVQVAEAVLRLRAQGAGARAADGGQAAGAARAERTAQHAADGVVWSRVLDPHWIGAADLVEAGRAWGAAAGWADTDPTARRVEARLAEQAPSAMRRFDDLRAGGADRVAAMRAVLADVAAESSSRQRVFGRRRPARHCADRCPGRPAARRARDRLEPGGGGHRRRSRRPASRRPRLHRAHRPRPRPPGGRTTGRTRPRRPGRAARPGRAG